LKPPPVEHRLAQHAHNLVESLWKDGKTTRVKGEIITWLLQWHDYRFYKQLNR
jgi:hypothetical protein